MTAPSKTFNAPTDAQIDIDSPVDETLMTQIRDALVHLEEWLGKDYAAATNHNHDGVNSAALDLGDSLRNNGFEAGTLTGWTKTEYTGGTVAASTTGAMEGDWCCAITSTSTVNGGGDIVCDQYIPVTGGDYLQVMANIKASASNVSSAAKVLWYDVDDGSPTISETTLYTTATTPTTEKLLSRSVEAPAAARFARIKLIGSVPGSGSSTGAVYFDNIDIGRPRSHGTVREYSAAGTFDCPVIGEFTATLYHADWIDTSNADEPMGGGSSSICCVAAANSQIIVGASGQRGSASPPAASLSQITSITNTAGFGGPLLTSVDLSGLSDNGVVVIAY